MKFNAKFNELSLFFPKTIASNQKMTKTKAVQEKANRHRSEAKR